MPDRLAVYGTLMRHGAFWQHPSPLRAKLQRLLRFEKTCTMNGQLLDLTPNLGPWPGLIAGEGTVQGELFCVLNDAAWPLLDAYEDVASGLYQRRAVALATPKGVMAQTYLFTGPQQGARLIRTGKWKACA